MAAADGTASREVAVLVRFPPMVEVRTFAGHTGIVHAVSLSADGKFAISGGSDGTVRLWNVATGAEIWKGEGHSGAVLSVAFSADGSQAVSGGVDKTVRVWETATGTSRTFSITAKPDAGHASAVWLVRFDDPKHVHSVSADKSIHWVAATGKPRQVPAGRPDLILGQKYKPDIANGEEIKPTTRVPTDSGEFLASGIGLQVATVWKRGATEKAAPRSIGHTPAMATPAKLFAISSDGSRLLTVGENNGIQLWDVGGTGTAARTAKAVAGFPWATEDEVTCVALDVDGKQALLGGRNGALKLWGLTSNNPAPSRTAARLTDDRSFWRFGPQIGSGYFRLMPDGKWEERGKGDGRPIGVWEEIGRTPEYVELYDPKRNRKTRLGAGKAWMTTGRDSTRFRPSPAGNWEKADANSGDRTTANPPSRRIHAPRCYCPAREHPVLWIGLHRPRFVGARPRHLFPLDGTDNPSTPARQRRLRPQPSWRSCHPSKALPYRVVRFTVHDSPKVVPVGREETVMPADRDRQPFPQLDIDGRPTFRFTEQVHQNRRANGAVCRLSVIDHSIH